jgi:hypothetical protein
VPLVVWMLLVVHDAKGQMLPSIIMFHRWVARWLNSAFYRCAWHSANQDPLKTGMPVKAVYAFYVYLYYTDFLFVFQQNFLRKGCAEYRYDILAWHTASRNCF